MDAAIPVYVVGLHVFFVEAMNMSVHTSVPTQNSRAAHSCIIEQKTLTVPDARAGVLLVQDWVTMTTLRACVSAGDDRDL